MSAVVLAKNVRGNVCEARILLDTCATANFVTENFANSLRLRTQPCSVPIDAIDGLTAMSTKRVQITFHSRISDAIKTLNFFIVPNIADFVPDEPFPRELFNIPANIRLADPQFHVPRSVDMLIGTGPTLSLLSVGQIKIERNNCEIILQKTALGWAIGGGADRVVTERGVRCKFTRLTEQLTEFWKIEEVGIGTARGEGEILCEEHYQNHTTRQTDGRYIVKLPFICEQDFGNSRRNALRRFHALQRKLRTDSRLNDEYSRVMQEYRDLGHMTLVQTADDASTTAPGAYYMPHHAVIKPTSNTTKLRVVFDASAKSDRGISLNDQLHVGPTIQDKIFVQLTRFRTHVFALTADIEKMYRQVLVHPDHRRYQRIFWYNGREVAIFQLNTVTFGVSSAPFLAIKTLEQLADDERYELPIAAKITIRDFYVDNLLTGANSLEEVFIIRDQIIELLGRGGFNLRQWASNHQHALDTRDGKTFQLDRAVEEGAVANTLGVGWDSRADNLVYSVKTIELAGRITKRHILSEVAKIFDPLGLLGPIILYAKLIIQDCWKEKCHWDESVSQELSTRWIKFARQLTLIQDFSIERRLLIDKPVKIEIHGFCDASEKGYGACIYLRSVDAENNINVSLICSKSRVAPLKSKTIPQLELCGALLLTRLFSETRPAFEFTINNKIFWTDSTIVLQWIKKPTSALKVFEANRVSEIQKLKDEVTWRHVRTHDNPADALSRGQLPREFLEKRSKWLLGPEWLGISDERWPMSAEAAPNKLPGLRSKMCLSTSVTRDIFSRFSSFKRMVRVLAYCLRWQKRVKYKVEFKKRELSLEEKLETERIILIALQREQFAKEITQLSQRLSMKHSKLTNLDPFLDSHGILRVGGRLKNATIPFDQKHPILLPSYHPTTDALIRETHFSTHHAGVQTTVYTMRLRFWLLDAKNQVRKIVRKCVTCTRFRPKALNSKMGNLPASRVEEHPVFSRVGVDFFGPLYIKEKKFRNRQRIKTYGCVFVCMVTKAVHIEIVSDLTTEGFLASFQRFAGRRGMPVEVFSDNGTNFVGANNQLKEMYALLNSDKFSATVEAYAVQRNIRWHFNPPLSPHFGGLWEAGVKAFKHHLKRVIGEQLLTFEDMNTLAVEIEAILNSRPLCTISTDPNDPLALTPAHFLIGRPLTALPQDDLTSVSANRLSTWRFIDKARQDFWRKWYLEYLNELQKRHKWTNSNHQLTRGSVVLLIDKALPCMTWRLGTIIETHPGDDGILRVVTVKTAQGNFKRNVTQLCVLPTSEN